MTGSCGGMENPGFMPASHLLESARATGRSGGGGGGGGGPAVLPALTASQGRQVHTQQRVCIDADGGNASTTAMTTTASSSSLSIINAAAAAVLLPHEHADELLVHVLEWLGPSDLCCARLVCRQWRLSADSNHVWRRRCGARWPSALTDPVRRIILAGGGYRAYYIASLLRPRSTMNDFVFTVDVTATSYVVLPYTEAVGGVSLAGSDLVPAADDEDAPDSRRFVATLRRPWRFKVVPYAFRTLGDLVDRLRPSAAVADLAADAQGAAADAGGAAAAAAAATAATAAAAAAAACHPELRVQLGVVHKSELKHAQVATLSEGRDLRTTAWYRARGAARVPGEADSTSPGGAATARAPAVSSRSPPPGAAAASSPPPPPGSKTRPLELNFSGSVVLPTHLGGVDRQVLDLSLRGTITDHRDETREYSVTHVVVGPLFNLNDGAVAATADDLTECLDLKLGLHTEAKGVASQQVFF
jgi:hypothetical protein